MQLTVSLCVAGAPRATVSLLEPKVSACKLQFVHWPFKETTGALAGVIKLVGAPSCKLKDSGFNSHQGIYLGCRFHPQWGRILEATD